MATPPLWVEKLGDHKLLGEVSQPDRTQITCMALAIYFESGNQPERGQRAVGNVVLNRTKDARFPNTMCGVLFQRGQFKFIKKGQPSIRYPKMWDRSVALAKEMFFGEPKDVTYGALSFRQKHLRKTGLIIGEHVFFKL